MGRGTVAIATAGAVIVGMLALGGTASAGEGPKPMPRSEQWRAYWVDSFSDGIYTPKQIDQLVADAKAVHANAIVVQVSRYQDCFCGRSTYTRTEAEGLPPAPYDPLDEVIERAHAAGLELHAWVNAMPMWHSPEPPTTKDAVFNQHGPGAKGVDRWLNKRVDGSETGDEGTFWFMDPANPDAADFIADGVTSIVREYDVDGVNLDFIRYPDYSSQTEYSEWGYSETSLRRFAAATGRTDRPEPDDEQFLRWRRDQVTNVVRKIYLGAYDADPRARISIDGIVYEHGPQAVGGWERTRTYREVLQDWRGWLDEGIIDTNLSMNYKVESDPEHVEMYNEWRDFLADHAYGRHTVVGPGLWLNTLEENIAQARRAFEPSPAGNTVAGWSGYSYAGPSSVASADPDKLEAERAKLAKALTVEDPTGAAEPLFAEEAAVPEMTWKTKPTTGNVTGELRLTDGSPLDQVEISMTNLLTGERVDGRRTDGSGWFGFANVAPGVWLVRAELPDSVVGGSFDVVRVAKGRNSVAKLGRPFALPG